MDGEVTYTQVRDDPRSVVGKGISMGDGNSARTISSGCLNANLRAMSPLFHRLEVFKAHSNVEFRRDVVSSDIHLESDAMKLDANGEFVIDGDMDYTIKSPSHLTWPTHPAAATTSTYKDTGSRRRTSISRLS